MPRSCRQQCAFSLAEVVIAIGVLAIIVLFLIGLVTTSYTVQGKGEESVAAVHVAENELDRWKSRPYAELATLNGSTTAPVDSVCDGREYRTTLTVSTLQPPAVNPDGRILRLAVSTTWQETTVLGEGGTKNIRDNSLQMESIVSPGASL